MLKQAAIGLALAVLVLGVGSVRADRDDDRDRDRDDDRGGIHQSGEQKDMRRVGHSDIQGRAAYQPNFIVYPNGREMAFIGTHAGSAPNPLKGGAVELNGTMIVDISDPSRPVDKAHIPSPAGGQSQMTRMCLGSQLPGGHAGSVYLLRNVQGGPNAGYELWDVTNLSAPVLLKALRNIRTTHKDWWECSTGIAYMPGSKNQTLAGAGAALWRQSQAMLIYDWSNPHEANHASCVSSNQLLTSDGASVGCPHYIRTYGLVGQQPGGTGTPDLALHGPISTLEHPQATQPLTRGAGPTDVIGNRIYAAWGVGDSGVMQIIDRKKLLPPAYGGTFGTNPALGPGNPDAPTVAEIEDAQVSLMRMSPDQGGHTTMPIFGMKPKSYQCYSEFKARDIVILSSEATSNHCDEAPHWAWTVDVTVENSKTSPPGTRVEQSPWQGPMVLATMSVDPRAGEKYPRGNYCTRGARFGVHSSEENFRNPYYGRLTFLAFFTGGIRAWDIREPQEPVEVGFYVPESNQFTAPGGYMTNNLEVDNRGYIIAVDRVGSGMDIVELRGKAREIGEGHAETAACVNTIPPGGGGGGG
jgi:hypothetical protein